MAWPVRGPALSTTAGGIGAVVLAAGSGSRLGGRPKSLLELDGVPLIRRVIAALTAAGTQDLVVVLGHHGRAIEAALQGTGARWIFNPQPDEGQVMSQRLGLAALHNVHEAVIVALADQPLIDADDVGALLRAWACRPATAQVLYPRVDGQPGNPVLFSAAVREQILRSEPSVGARQWRDAHPGEVAAFYTSNPHYRVDIDTPEDLARFQRETGRTLVWPQGLAGEAGC
ncbi:MAG: NTP transferase domain-containing protein [Rubrivivax sp.]